MNLAMVMAETRGFVIPKYRARPTQSSDVGGYTPCKFCLAMRVKADMWKYQCSCSLKLKGNESKAIGKAKRSAPTTTGKLLQPIKTKTMDVYANVVLPVKNDDVKSNVEMDPLIMAERSTEVIQGACCYTSANTSRTFGARADDGVR